MLMILDWKRAESSCVHNPQIIPRKHLEKRQTTCQTFRSVSTLFVQSASWRQNSWKARNIQSASGPKKQTRPRLLQSPQLRQTYHRHQDQKSVSMSFQDKRSEQSVKTEFQHDSALLGPLLCTPSETSTMKLALTNFILLLSCSEPQLLYLLLEDFSSAKCKVEPKKSDRTRLLTFTAVQSHRHENRRNLTNKPTNTQIPTAHEPEKEKTWTKLWLHLHL